MNFKKRKIRQHTYPLEKPTKNPAETPTFDTDTETDSNQTFPTIRNPQHHHYINWVTVGIGLLLVIGLFWITVSIIKSLDFGSVIFSFGKDLKKDSANKQTNFLLVGVGGAEHDGGNLTDTMMIASLDERTKSVKMLSIPRDMYVENKDREGQRMNKIYDTYLNKLGSSPEAMHALTQDISQMIGVPIHYYIKVDFSGFVKIIDALGGITVNVEKRLYDPQYPLGETIKYTTFSIDAGIQDIDGSTALKYARSRHSTSDFDRAKRQQQILAAAKEKALSLNILTDPSRLQAIYQSVSDSLETDLTIAEILELAKITKDISKDNIQSRVISDDFTSCGGFLYTPNRDYFGGAAVLLPAGNNFNEIKKFTQNYFTSTDKSTPEIQVLNGTKTSGLALNYLNRLSRQCLNVVYYGNATDRALTASTIYYAPQIDEQGNPTIPESIKTVQSIINAKAIEGIPPEYLVGEKRINSKIVLELGSDYKMLTTPDSFDKLMYTTPSPESTPTTPSAEKPLNTPANTPAGENPTTNSNKPAANSSSSQSTSTPSTTKPATSPAKPTQP